MIVLQGSVVIDALESIMSGFVIYDQTNGLNFGK